MQYTMRHELMPRIASVVVVWLVVTVAVLVA